MTPSPDDAPGLADFESAWQACLEAYQFQGSTEPGSFLVRLGLAPGNQVVSVEHLGDDFNDPSLTCCLQSHAIGASDSAERTIDRRYRLHHQWVLRDIEHPHTGWQHYGACR
ncbi:MAG: hypothetical protein AAF211_06785 [Myxococcota bacterium]